MVATKRVSCTTAAAPIPNTTLEYEAEGRSSSLDEDLLLMPAELKEELMPKHVAVIVDGHRRWAKTRGLPPLEGYVALVQPLRRVVKLCLSWGIKIFTVFVLSTENWVLRPKLEVEFLLSLFERTINCEIEAIMRERIKISVIGDSSKFPKSLQKMIAYIEEKTKDNSRLHLIVAINYGGRYDVVKACKSVAKKVQDGIIHLEDIDENIIGNDLETKCIEFPYPDLLIRTGGELRVSNFLLWQLAYTELFFNRKLWPDFEKNDFVEALSSFQQRERRFGGGQH